VGKLPTRARLGARRSSFYVWRRSFIAAVESVLRIDPQYSLRTPTPILERLHSAVRAALGAEDVKRVWASQGARVEPESRAEFTAFVGREVARWAPIVKATEIDMD